MQKQTEGRQSHSSAWEQTSETCNPQSEQYFPPGDALHDDFPRGWSSPQSGVLLSLRLCLHSIFTGQVQISSFMHKNLRQAFHSIAWAQPSSIHQQCPPSTQGPPSSATTPPPTLWHNAIVAFRAFMLAVVLGRLKTLCVRQPLSWVAWTGGTCWAASGETGMRIWMGQCVPGTHWQRDGVPLYES